MRLILIIALMLTGMSVQAQNGGKMNDKEVTNLVLVPHEYSDENMEVLNEVLASMEGHEGFLYMNRSDGVMSPQGPTGYREIIEVHWKDMMLMSEWSQTIPQEKGEALSGIQIVFYEYKN